MTMTGSSESRSLTARSTPMPSPFGNRKSDRTRAGWESRSAAAASGSIAGLDDVVALRLERELQHRAQRVFVFDEEDRGRSRARTQPAGGHAGATGFVLDRRNRLGLLVEFLLDPFELGERRLAIGFNLRPLRRVVAIGEIGRQRIDAALQRIGEDLRALQAARGRASSGRTRTRSSAAPALGSPAARSQPGLRG